MSGVSNKVIVRCSKTEVIESSFDWAGMFNSTYRTGAGYYSELQLTKGQFFNLVVPEDTDNGFSLYDINELDQALLLLLSEQLPINKILLTMQEYFDDEMLQNHYDVYEKLILSSIKDLVIKKAIKPGDN